ncbi:YSIRK-type signal peptide-containing protein, partial [Staphylococcus xylosus]
MGAIKKEKFSVRKRKLGVTSVLLGSIIFIGVYESKNAQASEDGNITKNTMQNEIKSLDNQNVSINNDVSNENSSNEKQEDVKKEVENKNIAENLDVKESNNNT